MSQNKIEIEKLVVGYNSPIVSDLSFAVRPGEIFALIGPNGAGKSTVLKTITRQLKKIGGKIYVCNEDESKLSEENIAKQISMVMTERIHPELMTSYDVVATGRYPYTGRMGILSADDKLKVEEAIKLVGADNIADTDFSKLSDGQRQRIMLARAICQEPEIMILDEPTSFLDIQYKLDLLSLICRMAKEKGIAVIMSIHELEFVPAVADKVVAVDGNNILSIGSPEEIITGEGIEKLYHMPANTGEVLVEGLLNYSKKLEVLCQK